MPNKNPISFETNLSPSEFAKLMFKNTDAEGNLYLNDWYDVVTDDTISCKNYRCNMSWKQEDLYDIIEEYESLQEELRFISQYLDELDEIHLAQKNPYIESSNGILKDRHLEAAYFIFVAPFKAKTEKQLRAQVIGRVGDELFGYEMIRHARRLCRLMQLNANENVIFHEGRMLIAAMIVHHYGKKIIPVK